MPGVAATKIGDGMILVPCCCGREEHRMQFIPGTYEVQCTKLKEWIVFGYDYKTMVVVISIDSRGLPRIETEWD